jgi:hypothetical protein
MVFIEQLLSNGHVHHNTVCLTKDYMKVPKLLQVNLKNYTSEASFCTQALTKGGVSINVTICIKFN